ncbi:uncharacterized protein LOC124453992 [Xenia sp. Carnegie-2017]|uniref:uncharacterized protein LOC124453992 n=1 Tax=Xenia sp. Carnegie-2017 TaxID=2897299 RepID=UPI001F03C3A1|nr:uncharacterized protein LOC124453992 [Xenia sp. Carnegie-2017]
MVYNCRVVAGLELRCVMLGDWNGHVGSVRKGYCAHGGFGVGDMNAEGEAILELAASCGMVVVNTWFIKEESKLVTYESGDSRTVVDYILVNEEERKNVKDAKVIAGEECDQHKLVMDWRIRKVKRRKVEENGRKALFRTARRSKKERNDILGAPGVQNHDGELKVLLEDSERGFEGLKDAEYMEKESSGPAVQRKRSSDGMWELQDY